MTSATTPDPFAMLGLPASAELTDEQVRAAWRVIATTTHPDLPGGGDPGRYAAASAAYAQLRTGWGRSEAYADLLDTTPPPHWPWQQARHPPTPAAGPAVSPWRGVLLIPARVRHGRPARLGLRIAAAAALGFLVLHAGAGTPAITGLLTGLATWLVLTARGDLAPPPGR
jgi:hypothetical protein